MIKPGVIIDQFKIIEPLGEGGMGEVFLAEDTRLSRKVAIKTIIPSDSEDSNQKDRFENEAKILASLNHPNIVSVYSYGTYEDSSYIAMEYIPGKNLSQILGSRGFGVAEALECIKQVVEGMDEAHNQGILHRDLKPANLVIDERGRLKIVDFGISKDYKNSEKDLTQKDQIVGTVSYLAPELISGQRPSSQSDIFSIGTIFFELLEGSNPFVDETKFMTMDNIRNKDAKISQDLAELLPPGIEDILYKMLAKSPANRYQSLKEIKADLLKINLKDFPEEIYQAKRPEVMILNEQGVRMRLLSKGFKTREIGMIISLAAQIQEKNLKFSDKTIPLDLKSKVAITEDVLTEAVKKFELARSDLNSKTNNKKSKHFKKTRSGHLNPLAYALPIALFVGSILVSASIYMFWPTLSKSFSSKSIFPAELYQIKVGDSFLSEVTYLDLDSGEVTYKETMTMTIENREGNVLTASVVDPKTGKKFYSKRYSNSFTPPLEYNAVNGEQGNFVVLGNYNGIYPLELGKTMTYRATGKSKKEGPTSFTKTCKVIGSEEVSMSYGTYPAWVVWCNSGEKIDTNRDSFQRYYYSPHLNLVLKKETHYRTGGKRILQVREVVKIISWD